jgi:hypothetical protein
MYCSTCGAAVPTSLSYCNRCGAELKAKQSGPMKLSETAPESLIWAIASVTIVGLGVVIGMMAVMKQVLNFNDSLIIAFSLLTFLTFLGVDAVFISAFLRLRIGAKEVSEKSLSTKELGEPQARALPEPSLSVTEHTTRTLERAESDRKTS